MNLRTTVLAAARRHLHDVPGIRGAFYRIDAARNGQRGAEAQRDTATAELHAARSERDKAIAERDSARAETQEILRWATKSPPPDAKDPLTAFQCNVCGSFNLVPRSRLDREISSCRQCGSSVRFRCIVHLVSTALYGKSIPLPDFPPDPAISGAGLSDWGGYADPLAQKFDFSNTYYHMEPRLDIVAPPPAMLGSLDFLTTSDVFEHVPPPASRAFAGSYALLKPGGHLILTVPFVDMPATIEHYPEMRDFGIVQFGDDYVVVARNADGSTTLHPNPAFHGGPGQTLEMRLFALNDLLRLLKDAGFTDIKVMSEEMPQFGIAFPTPFGLPILARKPA
jgi:hypothetical protein